MIAHKKLYKKAVIKFELTYNMIAFYLVTQVDTSILLIEYQEIKRCLNVLNCFIKWKTSIIIKIMECIVVDNLTISLFFKNRIHLKYP